MHRKQKGKNHIEVSQPIFYKEKRKLKLLDFLSKCLTIWTDVGDSLSNFVKDAFWKLISSCSSQKQICDHRFFVQLSRLHCFLVSSKEQTSNTCIATKPRNILKRSLDLVSKDLFVWSNNAVQCPHKNGSFSMGMLALTADKKDNSGSSWNWTVDL